MPVSPASTAPSRPDPTASRYRVWPGTPHNLGATWDGSGTNFALFSRHATAVELCLFDETGANEIARIPLPEHTHEVWHGYLPDVRIGQLYGFRVHGPYAPEEGHRFNPNKLLLDPYAKALVGDVIWDDCLFGYQVGHPDADLSFSETDSAPCMPKCQVVDTAFTWNEPLNHRPWHETILYELHVRGFTKQHPEVPAPLRGTFAGLAEAPVVDYLRNLGVTAIELLPVHAFLHDRHLVDRGLRNYWGYNSIGFFAPHPEYLSRGGLNEFKIFVQVMHDAGIEVILDVVYNHTAEGNHLGPTLSFRGIDNASYYHLMGDSPRYYNDFTGTGNALELRHRNVLRMVTDSLRYWVEEMRVDGFRFDLATTLARVNGVYDPHAGFLDAVAQDPVLSRARLIAEPWDTGMGGYQVGGFPPGWAEWNDRYRDTVRKFWKGDHGQMAELASRLSGSADIFGHQGRKPWASINFVTAHDGFTLHDLVSYSDKHNEANGEDNRDGHSDNHAWNHGAEGPTDDPAILALRRRQSRNLLLTLMISQGVPMLVAGDEFGRTQHGNNNAYCQDTPVSWLDWDGIDDAGRDLQAFTQALIRLRGKHLVFHRSRFFLGDVIAGTRVKDVTWLRPDGHEMTDQDWHDPSAKTLGMLLSGEAGMTHLTESGEPEPDQTFLVWLNASHLDITCHNPAPPAGHRWRVVADTMAAAPRHNAAGARTVGKRTGAMSKKGRVHVAARSSLILVRSEDSERADTPHAVSSPLTRPTT